MRWVLYFILVSSVGFAESLTFKIRGERIKTYSLEELVTLVPEVEITVYEPHDKVEETFKGFSIQKLFEKVYGSRWKKEEEVLFTCVDGYMPSVPLSQFEKYSAYLVYKRSPSNDFTLHPQKKSMEETPTPLGPFYLVWDNIKFSDLKNEGTSYWPYQVTTIDLVAFADRFKAMAPPPKAKADVKRGFLIFRNQCLACHTINGEGFKKGVELNYPVSVTEFLTASWLKKWITEPSSIRSSTTMPGFVKTSKHWKKDLADVIAYLKAMSKSKKAPVIP